MLAPETAARPKQARAIATRRRLLDGAVHALCELGYASTTTTEVCRRAGVSQGALYKHFASKQLLIAASAEHLFDGLVHGFREAFEAGANGDDRVGVALRELWAIFQTPELYVVMELYLASRTDESLRRALSPVLAKHRANIIDEARARFPKAALENPQFDRTVDGVVTAMQGAAMTATVLPDVAEGSTLLSFLEAICRRELEPPFGVDA